MQKSLSSLSLSLSLSPARVKVQQKRTPLFDVRHSTPKKERWETSKTLEKWRIKNEGKLY